MRAPGNNGWIISLSLTFLDHKSGHHINVIHYINVIPAKAGMTKWPKR